MRRVIFFIICVLMLISPVMAASGYGSAQSKTEVSSDGSCEVTLVVQLRLEEVQELVQFVPFCLRQLKEGQKYWYMMLPCM